MSGRGGYNPTMRHPTTSRSWTWLTIPLLGSFIWIGGCVRRVVEVTSEPSGAIVWMNDREVGTTPCTVEILHYGTYDVRLEKPGFEPKVEGLNASAPAWDLPGPDLVAELLPTEVVSRNRWHLVLHPEDMDDEAVMRRAVIARDRLAAQQLQDRKARGDASIEGLEADVRRSDGVDGPPGQAVGGALEPGPVVPPQGPDPGQAPDIPRPGSDAPSAVADD